MDTYIVSARAKHCCFVCETNCDTPVTAMHRCSKCMQSYCGMHTSALQNNAYITVNRVVICDGIEYTVESRSYADCPLCAASTAGTAGTADSAYDLAVEKANFLFTYRPAAFLSLLGEQSALRAVAARAILNSNRTFGAAHA